MRSVLFCDSGLPKRGEAGGSRAGGGAGTPGHGGRARHRSTAIFAVRRIGEWLRAGRLRDLVAVPTSRAIAPRPAAGRPLALDGARDIDLPSTAPTRSTPSSS
jgi:hypothetical protein